MAVVLEREKVERKIINITGKRQITIPISFYEQIGFDKEVECYSDGKVLILKPLNTNNSDFSVEILKDLIAQGYEGEELVEKFEEESKNIKKAIKNIIKEAKDIASGKKKSETIKDVFGEENVFTCRKAVQCLFYIWLTIKDDL